MNNQPIRLIPACKDYLWGGSKLREEFGVRSALEPLAEAWVLSAHPDGESIIAGGKFDGCTFTQYLEKAGDVCGTNVAQFPDFPILIKLIDAKRDLSVQVHPDDRYAMQVEGENGKTEMWYVLSAEPDAALYYGFSRPVTANEVRRRTADGTLTEVLNRVPVKAGDVFFLAPGTVHAIGAGLVICEIQQNSNTTYRLYDYDRRDAAGNKRPLHVDKALAVARLIPMPREIDAPAGYLAACRYFAVREFTVGDSFTGTITPQSFVSLVIVDGAGTLTVNDTVLAAAKGDSFFLPAQDGTYHLSGTLTAVETTIPKN